MVSRLSLTGLITWNNGQGSMVDESVRESSIWDYAT